MTIATLVVALALCASPAEGRPIGDFKVSAPSGVSRSLSDYDEPFVVVAFIGTQCPLAKMYGPRLDVLAEEYKHRGVACLGINSNASDAPGDLQRFAAQTGIRFPMFKDADGTVADQFGATRQLEVFVLDRARTVRYHGRVDDQYQPGGRRSRPTRKDLKIALDELLSGRAVSVRETEFSGCFIERRDSQKKSAVITYAKEIAPILHERCVECHRPGQIAPFSLTSYQDAKTWSATIRERINDGSMPPWHADPQHGRFSNERRLSDREKEQIFAWIDNGMAEGDTQDLPPPRQYTDAWNIGRPDKILTMPEPFHVPANGTIDNIAVELDPGFSEDTWVRGTEVHPGNRSVVHHCTVFIGPPGCKDLVDTGLGDLHYFSDFVPGLMPALLPAGMARKVPAGWHIYFSLHYVPNGTPAVDQTCMGLVLSPRPQHEVFTDNLLNNEFTIAPHEAHKQVSQSWTVPRDMLLLSMFPHMHLRGKAFRYEAIYPCGTTEVLLDVTRYDFMWQHRYILAEPKLLPAGTILRATAIFDNSTANKFNPDATATVTYGKRTTDEMFHGYFDGVFLTPPPNPPNTHLILAFTSIIGCWTIIRRRQRA